MSTLEDFPGSVKSRCVFVTKGVHLSTFGQLRRVYTLMGVSILRDETPNNRLHTPAWRGSPHEVAFGRVELRPLTSQLTREGLGAVLHQGLPCPLLNLEHAIRHRRRMGGSSEPSTDRRNDPRVKASSSPNFRGRKCVRPSTRGRHSVPTLQRRSVIFSGRTGVQNDVARRNATSSLLRRRFVALFSPPHGARSLACAGTPARAACIPVVVQGHFGKKQNRR